MSKSFSVPQSVRAAAKRGLELRREHKEGGLDSKQAKKEGVGSGVQRASDLVSGSVSYETIKRMKSFFARHSAYKKHHSDRTSAAYISWQLWGGDAGESWSNRIVREEEARKEREKDKVNKALVAFINEVSK
jgi:hypothetical protein